MLLMLEYTKNKRIYYKTIGVIESSLRKISHFDDWLQFELKPIIKMRNFPQTRFDFRKNFTSLWVPLKCGFLKKPFIMNAPLCCWTSLHHLLALLMCAQQQKRQKVMKRYSTAQRCIHDKWLLMKSTVWLILQFQSSFQISDWKMMDWFKIFCDKLKEICIITYRLLRYSWPLRVEGEQVWSIALML